VLTPGILRHLSGDQSVVISGLLGEFLPHSAALCAEQLRVNIACTNNVALSLSPLISELMFLEGAYLRSDFRSVVERAGTVAANVNPFFKLLFWRFTMYALLELGEMNKAVRLVVERYLEDPSILPMLLLKFCFDKMSDEYKEQAAGDISTPILIDLVSRHVEDHSTELRYAYEDFLLFHGVRRPSELIKIHGQFPKTQLIYYLRFISIPTVMQLSPEFPSSRELEDERVLICAVLKDLDDRDANLYESEIREITRKQSINRGLREFERSKIWIDQEGLRKWASKAIEESYARFLALREVGIRSNQVETIDV
jgi:hypothetical protein